jgi:hypothetical protein
VAAGVERIGERDLAAVGVEGGAVRARGIGRTAARLVRAAPTATTA